MTKHHHILLLVLLLAAAGRLPAQTLPTGEVDVIKDFNARLAEAEKFNLRPELPALDTMRKRVTYSIPARMLEVNYPAPKIRPLALRGEPAPPSYNGYARLGAGGPKAFLAEGNYSVARENLLFNIGLRHNSANNNANVANQRFSNNDFHADGTYYFDQGFAVRARAGYSQDFVYFYGHNDIAPDTTFASDDVKQRFSLFEVGGEIFNGKETQADFNYNGSVNIYLMQDFFSARENGIDLKLQGTKWFDERHPLQVILRTDFSGFRDTARQSLNNIFLNPSFTYHGDRFRVKVGMNLASSSDEFFFFPDLELSVNVLDQILTAYAGATGNLVKNNFRNLTEYNPFLTSRPELRNTNFNYFFGGIKGEFFNINYQAEAGYKNAKDLALFLSDFDTIPRFNALYDTVDIFVLKGSLTMPLFDKLDLTGAISQSVYSTKNQEKAWHLPSLEVNVGARFRALDDQLRLRADLFVENGVPFRDADGNVGNLNALFDVSAGAEYLFTANIGAFVQVNNLLNNKRERWQSYPVLGLNALAGLSARF